MIDAYELNIVYIYKKLIKYLEEKSDFFVDLNQLNEYFTLAYTSFFKEYEHRVKINSTINNDLLHIDIYCDGDSLSFTFDPIILKINIVDVNAKYSSLEQIIERCIEN